MIVSLEVQAAEGEARQILNERGGIPEVLLLIPSQYHPFIIDEISNIM